MSEWITDRRPTEKDADFYGCVWVTVSGEVFMWMYEKVRQDIPWMSCAKPQPYVAPLRYTVVPSVFRDGEWVVEYDKMLIADKIPTREAAERIANIYNEVMS